MNGCMTDSCNVPVYFVCLLANKVKPKKSLVL